MLSRHTVPVGRRLGIPIDLDPSWFLVFALLTWTLAVGYYPAGLGRRVCAPGLGQVGLTSPRLAGYKCFVN